MGIISNVVKSKAKSAFVNKVFPVTNLIPGNDSISRTINAISIFFPITLALVWRLAGDKKTSRTFLFIWFVALGASKVYCDRTGKPFWTYRQ